MRSARASTRRSGPACSAPLAGSSGWPARSGCPARLDLAAPAAAAERCRNLARRSAISMTSYSPSTPAQARPASAPIPCPTAAVACTSSDSSQRSASRQPLTAPAQRLGGRRVPARTDSSSVIRPSASCAAKMPGTTVTGRRQVASMLAAVAASEPSCSWPRHQCHPAGARRAGIAAEGAREILHLGVRQPARDRGEPVEHGSEREPVGCLQQERHGSPASAMGRGTTGSCGSSERVGINRSASRGLAAGGRSPAADDEMDVGTRDVQRADRRVPDAFWPLLGDLRQRQPGIALGDHRCGRRTPVAGGTPRC